MILIEELTKRTIVIGAKGSDRIVVGLLGQRVRVAATRMAGTLRAVAVPVQAKDRGMMQRWPEV